MWGERLVDIFIDIGLDYFSKYHYDKVSISEIVQKSGKGKSSFYSKHSSKEQFYLNLVTYIQGEKVRILESHNGMFDDDIFLGLKNYQLILKLMKERDPRFLLFWKMLNTDPSDVPMRVVKSMTNTELMKQQIVMLLDRDLIRKDLSVDIMTSYVANGLIGIMHLMTDVENINDMEVMSFIQMLKDALKYKEE